MNSENFIQKRNFKKNKNNKNHSLTGNSFGHKSKQKSLTINNASETFTYLGNSSHPKNNKTKLTKSIYSGFTKTTFGSIPYKTENFLLNKKDKNPRFNDIKSIFYSDKISNPGVGRYNITKDFEITGWDMKFGGFGNRFKSSFNFIPGAGDYRPEDSKVKEKKRHDIRYKGLYKLPDLEQQLLKINNEFKDKEMPNCATYTPLYQDEVMRLKKMYTFDSFTGRNEYTGYDMPFEKKNDYPGPGRYTYIADLFGSNNRQMKFNYDDKSEIFDDSEIKKHPDKVFKRYSNKNEIMKMKFKLKSRSPKYNNIKIMTSEELQLKNKKEKIDQNKVPQLELLLKNMDKKDKRPTDFRFYLNQQKELDYIKSILGNDNGKRDLFYLSSPRWKENKLKLKIPGPAYYFN